MALHTETHIRIKGHQSLANTFESLTISEDIDGHHTFSLALPGQAFGAGSGTGQWRELVGTRITIEIAPLEHPSGGGLDYEPKLFAGLITGLQLSKAYGPNGRVVLKGGSPTLLADDDMHTQSFSSRSLKSIAEESLGHYPVNLLRPQVDPQTNGSLKYVVQYKENSWQFLRRLARTHGEWFYYNGENVVFGRRNPQTFKLTHDVDLDDFSLYMGIRPANMALSAYDYTGDALESSTTNAPSGLNAHSQAMVDAGPGLFPRQGQYTPNRRLNGSASRQIKTVAARQAEASVAGMVTLSGRALHPGLTVGDHVAVEEAIYGSEAYGEYMLTRVEHRCSSDGDYHNIFRGIPADVAAPPHRLDDHPQAEAQSAIVVDNNDPDDLGRVQVQLRWQQGHTLWLRMVAPGGGSGKGFHMIPEKGEEVIVDFEGGNPERPYVLGTTRNSSSASGFGTETNDIKAIRTRSGHTIELNDKEGGESITITDKKNNTIRIDTTESNIDITANETVTVNAKNLKFNISENMEVSVGKNKLESVGKKRSLSAKSSVIMVDEASQMQAKEILQNAKKITLNSTEKDMELSSARKVISNSGEKNILN